MSRKIFDYAFFACSALAGAAAVAASGCSAQAVKDAGLLTPGPSGKTPLDEGLEAIPKVVGNPLDLEAWSKITGVAVLGVAATFGYKKIKRGAVKAERKRVVEEARVAETAVFAERAAVADRADVADEAVLAERARVADTANRVVSLPYPLAPSLEKPSA